MGDSRLDFTQLLRPIERVRLDFGRPTLQCRAQPVALLLGRRRSLAVDVALGCSNVGDALGRAYNRTTFADQRRELMTKWADYLDRLRKGADVVALPSRAA